jgi:succinate-semialdehyde dehydrogenase/glutarate-semialdehyde dehydrogenase
LVVVRVRFCCAQKKHQPNETNPQKTNQKKGNTLTSSETVRKIGFTGSTAVGKLLMAQAAQHVMRVSLELGGNAPFIVFEDADLDLAARGVVASALRNAGQTCICANRVFVHDAVYDAFAARVVDAVAKLRVGDGLDAGVTTGPLITPAALEKVEAHVADALAKGARLLAGGKRPDFAAAGGPAGGATSPGSALAGGNFYEPTVLADATIGMCVCCLFFCKLGSGVSIGGVFSSTLNS